MRAINFWENFPIFHPVYIVFRRDVEIDFPSGKSLMPALIYGFVGERKLFFLPNLPESENRDYGGNLLFAEEKRVDRWRARRNSISSQRMIELMKIRYKRRRKETNSASGNKRRINK
jgi:hypothetical protein